MSNVWVYSDRLLIITHKNNRVYNYGGETKQMKNKCEIRCFCKVDLNKQHTQCDRRRFYGWLKEERKTDSEEEREKRDLFILQQQCIAGQNKTRNKKKKIRNDE